MNDIRKYINLIESMDSSDDIIPGERPKYNTLSKHFSFWSLAARLQNVSKHQYHAKMGLGQINNQLRNR